GFTGPFAWLVQRLVPKRPAKEDAVIQPRYLDDLLLDTPALALDRARMELRRLGERAHHMVVQSLPTVFKGTKEDLKALADLDDEVDVLHTAIVGYLGKLSQENLGMAQSQQIYHYVGAANNIENIGDMIETNIVAAGLERLRTNLETSIPTQEVLGELHAKVAWAVQMALESLDASDPGMAANVIDAKAEINRLASRAEMHLANRLAINEADRLPLYRIESEIIEYLKRVYYFAKQIAKGLVGDEVPSPDAVSANDDRRTTMDATT
ncbi:MAG TPA: PhoU domain-containing protein, partial [Rhodothermales bacterium]|nr:PhoU domain-containing protein [Rhodothermales bacterium]